MRLIRPDLEMKDAFSAYCREWEASGEKMVPFASRLGDRTYETWLEDTWRLETQPNGSCVPAHTFFALDSGGEMIGVISVRHTLNEYLLWFGGHIGYGVRPSARRHGHATAMLAAALPVARGLGLSRVMVSCNKENIGSARTIQNNGGVLENEVVEDGQIVQRYWISL